MKIVKILAIYLLLLPVVPSLAWCSPTRPQLAILYSDYTLNWFIHGPPHHPDEPWGEREFYMYPDGWVKFLTARKVSYIIVSDSDIEVGRLSGIKVLILPNAAALSEKEVNNIQAFERHGGSIIATFGTSWLDEHGKIWHGGRFALWQLWGIPVSKGFGMFVKSIHIVKISPVTTDVAIGMDVEYHANANTLETKEPILPRTSITAFLVDDSGKVTDHAAIVEREQKGKVVYFAFSPEYIYSLGEGRWTEDMGDLMFNALAYCLE